MNVGGVFTEAEVVARGTLRQVPQQVAQVGQRVVHTVDHYAAQAVRRGGSNPAMFLVALLPLGVAFAGIGLSKANKRVEAANAHTDAMRSSQQQISQAHAQTAQAQAEAAQAKAELERIKVEMARQQARQ